MEIQSGQKLGEEVADRQACVRGRYVLAKSRSWLLERVHMQAQEVPLENDEWLRFMGDLKGQHECVCHDSLRIDMNIMY